MRRLAAVLLLTALAPLAAATSVPFPRASAVDLPAAPDLPLPAVVLDAGPARVAADLPEGEAEVDATLAAPALAEPVRVHVDKERHVATSPAAERLSALAQRRAERAFPPPARLAPAAPPAADARDDAPPAEGTRAFAPPAPAPEGPSPARAQAAFAAPQAQGRWTGLATLAAVGLLALLAPLALYHRLRGARTLEGETRSRVFDLLRERPGLTPTDAARALGLDPKTAQYHLVRLAKEGLAVAEGPARGVRYFAAGTVAAHERPALVAASDSRAVLDAVLRAPGLTKTQLAEAVGVARPTVSWHVRRLAAAGLVRCERAGRGVRVLPLIPSIPKALNSEAT